MFLLFLISLSVVNCKDLYEAQAYWQCGGKIWIGSKTCVAGTTCTKVNDWFSWCTPSINLVYKFFV